MPHHCDIPVFPKLPQRCRMYTCRLASLGISVRCDHPGRDKATLDEDMLDDYNPMSCNTWTAKVLYMAAHSQVIQQLVERVVETVHPLRVVLFGSAARNAIGPHSDIDLLVVMPDGTHRRQTSQKLYRQIRGVGVPFDILVATPRDLKTHKDNVGLIYKTILRDGVDVRSFQ